MHLWVDLPKRRSRCVWNVPIRSHWLGWVSLTRPWEATEDAKWLLTAGGRGKQKDTNADRTLEHSEGPVEGQGWGSTLGTVSIYPHWQDTWKDREERGKHWPPELSLQQVGLCTGPGNNSSAQWQCPQGCIMSIVLLAKVISFIVWASRRSQRIKE